MLRETVEEYLDGELDAVNRAKVESAIAEDAQAATLVNSLKAQRALRAAALESFAPSAQEAGAFASQVLALCEDQANRPLWRIATAVRRGAAVAAAIAVIAGAFMAGRTTAPVKTVAGPVQVQEVTKYSVAFVDTSGTVQVKECDGETEMANYVASIQQQGATGIQVADLASNHI